MECVQLGNCIILSQAIKLYRCLNIHNAGRVNRHESTEDIFSME